MAHNYDPVPVFHATVPLPDDGDPAIAASVNGPLEDLADNISIVVDPIVNGGTIVLTGGELELSGGLLTLSGGLDVRTVGAVFHSDVLFNEDTTFGSSAADVATFNASVFINDSLVVGSATASTLFRTVTTFSNSVTFSDDVSSDGTLEVNGTAAFNGTATFNGNVQIGDASSDGLDVFATTVFRGLVTIGNDSGSEGFTVNSATNFEDTVEFNATVTIDGDVNCNGDFICGGDATFTNDMTLGNGASDAINILGSTTITNIVAPVGFSSDGRILMRITTGPNATSSIDLDAQDVIHVPTLTADRTYNVSFAGGVDGSWCWIVKESGTAGVLEINWTGGTSTFLAAQKAAILFMLRDGAIITLPRI